MKGTCMKPQLATRLAAVTLIIILPICEHSAEAKGGKATSETASVSADDLNSVSERIRQTGAQLQADIKKARARLDAQQAKEEAERKREAEQARQLAIKEEKQKQAQEVAQVRARQEELARIEKAERQKEEQAAERLAAKERAAAALSEARASAGISGTFSESVSAAKE
jgi:hypothetical protein